MIIEVDSGNDYVNIEVQGTTNPERARMAAYKYVHGTEPTPDILDAYTTIIEIKHTILPHQIDVPVVLTHKDPPKEQKEYKAKEVKCTKDTEMVMVTFGGQQVHPMKAGETMYYDRLFHQNDKFTVVQSGLNHYTMATSDFEWKK